MQSIQELTKQINSQIGSRKASPCSKAELAQMQANQYNRQQGDLKHFDCSVCKNKGYIAYVNDDEIMALRPCKCLSIRETRARIEKSGLSALIETHTLDNFKAVEKWQQSIKAGATAFVNDTFKNWFFIGGQNGSGKTMICTAIVAELMQQGKDARYMLWRDEIVALKANVNNYAEYERLIMPLKNAPVLYIDDFFKMESGKMPTLADVNIAFELLNYRYNNPALITIISCEFMISDILKIDEAVGSRIYERSKNYQFNIEPDVNKNYRLR